MARRPPRQPAERRVDPGENLLDEAIEAEVEQRSLGQLPLVVRRPLPPISPQVAGSRVPRPVRLVPHPPATQRPVGCRARRPRRSRVPVVASAIRAPWLREAEPQNRQKASRIPTLVKSVRTQSRSRIPVAVRPATILPQVPRHL